MKTIVRAGVAATAMLTLSNMGYAQQPTRKPPAADLAPEKSNGSAIARDHAVIADVQSAAPVSKRKAVRPEKTFGPDLVADVFAPVGVIVAPINSGLHAVDTAVAPVNEALRPITGPLVVEPVVAAAPPGPVDPGK